jgi:chorismate mutase/prephenate dehydratase
MPSDELENLRKKIDDIDTELIRLINERAKVSKQIGLVKSQIQAAVFQPDREKKVIEHIQTLASEISPSSAQEIWKEIMAACRQVQGERNRVAYFGPEGTFTQQAALAFFPKGTTEFIPIDRKHEIFQQVEGDYVNFGILPVENSLNGSVSETLDLLIERNLLIYGEIEIRIKHNLIGLPNSNISQIKTVYSHPQALAQSSIWLKKNLPAAELFETVSTAKAVQKVKETNDPSIAAIGTELAAELYSLNILAKGIEDNTSNYTRFVIVSKKVPNPTGNDKTSIVFVTKHIPGALFNILKYFAEANINLAKIESRPRKIGKDSLWEYIFILDFDEHQDRAKDVLEKVREQSIWLKVLGSYPQRPRKVN